MRGLQSTRPFPCWSARDGLFPTSHQRTPLLTTEIANCYSGANEGPPSVSSIEIWPIRFALSRIRATLVRTTPQSTGCADRFASAAEPDGETMTEEVYGAHSYVNDLNSYPAFIDSSADLGGFPPARTPVLPRSHPGKGVFGPTLCWPWSPRSDSGEKRRANLLRARRRNRLGGGRRLLRLPPHR